MIFLSFHGWFVGEPAVNLPGCIFFFKVPKLFWRNSITLKVYPFFDGKNTIWRDFVTWTSGIKCEIPLSWTTDSLFLVVDWWQHVTLVVTIIVLELWYPGCGKIAPPQLLFGTFVLNKKIESMCSRLVFWFAFHPHMPRIGLLFAFLFIWRLVGFYPEWISRALKAHRRSNID